MNAHCHIVTKSGGLVVKELISILTNDMGCGHGGKLKLMKLSTI